MNYSDLDRIIGPRKLLSCVKLSWQGGTYQATAKGWDGKWYQASASESLELAMLRLTEQVSLAFLSARSEGVLS